MSEIYDLVIVGAGPAGITASIYATRAMLKFVILEKSFAGGQIINTYEVDNYPGIQNVSGFDLSNMFTEHATSLGVEIKSEDVIELILDGPIKKVITSNGELQSKTIILSTGAQWKKLGVPGEDQFTGLGVSYCATCDGAFYKGKQTVVIGGGDVAVEDAIYLSRMCEKVTLVHRRNELRAVKVLQDKLLKTPNIEVIWDTELEEIFGDTSVEGVKIYNKKTGEKTTLNVSGVFIAVGTSANSELVKDQLKLDSGGWILTDEDCETSIKGVFAVGDVRKKSLKQVITAAADGAIAVFASERYI
ncbi:MAG: thioredoxin-disulfide reductase [Firmicutes bacterium HGW-Firmicutes-7]|nr:MAG: thioredoxin-disulfide reductase [Firmicutes bacterium HGW-Firmicutes-7]